MSRRIASVMLLLAALSPAPALAQQPAKLRPSTEKPRAPAAPVIACLSLANYRMLMHDGPAAAASVLADPKADHLGCASLPRNRIGAVVDRVSLAGRAYDCAAVKDTTACHWVEAGTLPAAGEEGWR